VTDDGIKEAIRRFLNEFFKMSPAIKNSLLFTDNDLIAYSQKYGDVYVDDIVPDLPEATINQVGVDGTSRRLCAVPNATIRGYRGIAISENGKVI
jgi:hypothetical protein